MAISATRPDDHETGSRVQWPDFLEAVHTSIDGACCGAGGGGARAALAPRAKSAFARLGHDAWRTHIKPRSAKVASRRGSYVLPGVTIIEPGSPARHNVDVTIVGEWIAAIDPASSLSKDGRVIEELRGQVVAPALADLHVHMPAANALRLTPLFMLLQLRHGIVRVRDAGDPDGTATPAALELLYSGALPGPDLHYAYAFVGDGRARWGNTLQMTSVDDAAAIIHELRHVGAKWVKAYENLDVTRLRALEAAASKAGLRVMGHVPTALSFEEALLPDAQHGFGVPDPRTLRRDHVLNRAIDWESVTEDRIALIVEACLQHQLTMTPTLSTSCNLLRLESWTSERGAADVRLLPRFYPEVVWHPEHGLPAYRNIDGDDFARARDALDRKRQLVAALSRAGVRLRLGTDTQQPFVVPGIALHAEIQAFIDAGVSRSEAWRLASRDAASALGVSDAGEIRIGARADLLVSPSSPLETGWSPDAISATVCGGACVMSNDLDAAIEQELARFESQLADHISRWLARFALSKATRRFVA